MKTRLFVLFLYVLTVTASLDAVPTDSLSSATKKWKRPPAGYTYQLTILSGVIGYIVQYNDNLYRGKDITPLGAKRLKEIGVNTFITIAPEEHQLKLAADAGLKTVVFPFHGKIVPGPDLQKFLQIIKENKGGFYLHSAETNHKAGALGAIYRIYIENWSFDKAIIEFGRLGGSLKDDDLLLRSIRKTR